MLSLKKSGTRISPIVLRTLGTVRPGFAVRAGGFVYLRCDLSRRGGDGTEMRGHPPRGKSPFYVK